MDIIDLEKLYAQEDFCKKFNFSGKLGALYKKQKTLFRLWAPLADQVFLNIYNSGNGCECPLVFAMQKKDKGIFETTVKGDLHKKYYTFSVFRNDQQIETIDPYALGAGVNGERGMIVDFLRLNPEGWEQQSRPELKNICDAIIYEAHIRDFSIDNSSGISPKNKGRFLGMVESGTKNAAGYCTGIDHLKELGITDIHILPFFDFGSTDESRPDIVQYNWGYDPKNYNVLEGSYSSDAFDGAVRIKEFKQMIQSFHNNGIRVVMDVVYNHTHNLDFCFNRITPAYFYRTKNGEYTNGSGCGNETASEKFMVQKYIVDSVLFWAREYKIDGFRFDLMGLHDLKTMKLIQKQLAKLDKNIIVYGEPWTGGDSPLPKKMAAIKANKKRLGSIAIFNDDIRNALKGGVFSDQKYQKGFATGKKNLENRIKKLIPSYNLINYVSCHDNLTFWDKMLVSNKKDSEQKRLKMNKLAMAVIFTMQGTPFFLSGEEFTRSKPTDRKHCDVYDGYDSNSYCATDEINSIKWDNKTSYYGLFEYYRNLIALRKKYAHFRLASEQERQTNISFVDNMPKNTLGYIVKKDDKKLLVLFNSSFENVAVTLPKGDWGVLVKNDDFFDAATERVVDSIQIPQCSMLLLEQTE